MFLPLPVKYVITSFCGLHKRAIGNSDNISSNASEWMILNNALARMWKWNLHGNTEDNKKISLYVA
jgi:hypothetical protein